MGLCGGALGSSVGARGHHFFVSTVTELELYSSPDLNDEEEAGVPRLLTDMFVVPLDSRLARSAGSLRWVYRLQTPDSAIAATALLTKTTLPTP